MSPAEGQLTGRDPPPSLTLKIQGYFDSPDQNPQFKVEVLPSTTARQLAVKIEQKTGMGRHLQMLKTESGDCIWNGWFQVECSGVNLSMDQLGIEDFQVLRLYGEDSSTRLTHSYEEMARKSQ